MDDKTKEMMEQAGLTDQDLKAATIKKVMGNIGQTLEQIRSVAQNLEARSTSIPHRAPVLRLIELSKSLDKFWAEINEEK